MRVSLDKMKLVGLEITFGLMASLTTESGPKTKWKEEEI